RRRRLHVRAPRRARSAGGERRRRRPLFPRPRAHGTWAPPRRLRRTPGPRPRRAPPPRRALLRLFGGQLHRRAAPVESLLGDLGGLLSARATRRSARPASRPHSPPVRAAPALRAPPRGSRALGRPAGAPRATPRRSVGGQPASHGERPPSAHRSSGVRRPPGDGLGHDAPVRRVFGPRVRSLRGGLPALARSPRARRPLAALSPPRAREP